MSLRVFVLVGVVLGFSNMACKQRQTPTESAVKEISLCPQFPNGCPVRAAEYTREKGLFAQLSTLGETSDADVKEYFEHICSAHSTLSAENANRIHNIVLQDVADEEGRLYMAYREGLPGTATDYHPTNHKIDVIAPYFKCFDKVFFGTIDPVWKGAGSLYVDGIGSEKFRWDYINKSTVVMDRLQAIFPSLDFNWYLTFEANLSYLYLAKVKEGYKALFKELTERMAARKQGHTLWSPTFWNKFSKIGAAEKKNLGNQIMEVFKAAPHIDMIHFQDFLGATSNQKTGDRVTEDDAIGYYRLIANLPTRPAHVGVNIEHYVVKCPTCAPEAPTADMMVNREEYYLRAEVPIGTSWEIRFWRKAHKD